VASASLKCTILFLNKKLAAQKAGLRIYSTNLVEGVFSELRGDGVV